MKNSVLDTIAIKHGTDKSSKIHNYCDKYEKYLPFQRNDHFNLLEIGVLDGESLKTWREYYYNALIVGIDIEPTCEKYNTETINIEIGSQDDTIFLNNVIEKYNSFDLIIDDGSHMQSHMIKSFEILFPKMKKNGVYVIEDVGCSYWKDYEGGLGKDNTSVEYFKKLIDDVNFRGDLQENFWNVHARREDFLIPQVLNKYNDIRIDIESIQFLNGVIIIHKR